jgi:Zn-finger nucleic acid-binding protein
LLNQLEYVVICSLVLALLIFFILQKRKAKSKIRKGSEVDNDEQDNLLSKYEELQKKILDISSQLSSLEQLNTKVASLDSLKTDLTAINSFAGNDILFCPATNEPMRRITVEGEDIDVSSKGCWFDAGELLSILDRSDNFLAQLKSYISQNASTIKVIESSIDKQNEIESRKKYVAHLYTEFTRSHNQGIKNKITQHNKRIRFLKYGADTPVTETSFPSNQPQQSFGSAPSSSSNLQKPFQSSSFTSSSVQNPNALKCPASGKSMTEITVEGIKLDVSPFGVWFDGRDNFANSKPEIIQVLEKKQNFLSSLFGSPSLSEIIEQKTSEVKKQDELEQKILYSRNRIIQSARTVASNPPNSSSFDHNLSNSLQLEKRWPN